MAPSYRLVLRSGKAEGTTFALEKNEIFLGRDAANDISINDPEISRRHVRIFLQGPNYIIEDLGSTNGTSVNGQRLMGPYLLHPGEMITFGEHVNLLYEMVPSGDATVVSSGAFRQPVVSQAVAPAPPAYGSSTPQPAPYVSPPPVYAGHVPAQPEYDEPKKKFPIWLIILLILILVVICACGLLAYFMPESWWCAFLGGWVFGPDVCPL